MGTRATDGNVSLWSILGVFGISLVGSEFGLYFALVLVVVVGGPELAVPAWCGLAAVAAPLWTFMTLWGPSDVRRRIAISVLAAGLALGALVPAEESALMRLALAFLAAILLIPAMWLIDRVHRWLGSSEPLGVLLLAIAGVGVAYSAAELLNADVVATWNALLAFFLAGALAVVILLGVDRPHWSLKQGWYRTVGWALIGALVLAGVFGLVVGG